MNEPTNAFDAGFKALTGHLPFPWQSELYNRFVADREDNIPDTACLPTGLGKTSVVAIWLLARLNSPDRLPRRLVYVVNRRTVVDQTTAEVSEYRQRVTALDLNHPLRAMVNQLGLSTLRGQFADNQEWSDYPSNPAVICGTVDMIGSRLLFQGYRIGFRSRPLHAGFLGQDVLLVHDEAHLEPAFQKLITNIAREQRQEMARGASPAWPGLRVMAMSATAPSDNRNAQTDSCQPFELTDEEKQPPNQIPDPPTEPIHHVWRRLSAKKAIRLHLCDDEKKKLVDQVVGRALKHKTSGDATPTPGTGRRWDRSGCRN